LFSALFPTRYTLAFDCEEPARAKAQRLRLIAETTTKAQLINWFQAVKIKIRPVAFVLPPTTPKKSRNMSLFFLVGIFFYDTRKGSGANFRGSVVGDQHRRRRLKS
jgi:hypothetical protein